MENPLGIYSIETVVRVEKPNQIRFCEAREDGICVDITVSTKLKKLNRSKAKQVVKRLEDMASIIKHNFKL